MVFLVKNATTVRSILIINVASVARHNFITLSLDKTLYQDRKLTNSRQSFARAFACLKTIEIRSKRSFVIFLLLLLLISSEGKIFSTRIVSARKKWVRWLTFFVQHFSKLPFLWNFARHKKKSSTCQLNRKMTKMAHSWFFKNVHQLSWEIMVAQNVKRHHPRIDPNFKTDRSYQYRIPGMSSI